MHDDDNIRPAPRLRSAIVLHSSPGGDLHFPCPPSVSFFLGRPHRRRPRYPSSPCLSSSCRHTSERDVYALRAIMKSQRPLPCTSTRPPRNTGSPRDDPECNVPRTHKRHVISRPSPAGSHALSCKAPASSPSALLTLKGCPLIRLDQETARHRQHEVSLCPRRAHGPRSSPVMAQHALHCLGS